MTIVVTGTNLRKGGRKGHFKLPEVERFVVYYKEYVGLIRQLLQFLTPMNESVNSSSLTRRRPTVLWIYTHATDPDYGRERRSSSSIFFWTTCEHLFCSPTCEYVEDLWCTIDFRLRLNLIFLSYWYKTDREPPLFGRYLSTIYVLPLQRSKVFQFWDFSLTWIFRCI